MSPESRAIFVEAPARLHFGMLDLRGDLGRRFGGIGAAIPAPSLLLEARRDRALTVEGPADDVERARAAARRFLAHHRLDGGARICLMRTIPAHVGLGSGTQLALAVARALAELYGLSTDPAALARAVDRGRRSAVGTWTFALGGFVLEGGRRSRDDAVAPLLAHLPIPNSWHCIVAVPPGAPGLSGEEEAAAFARLPPPSAEQAARISHLVLLQLLPALAQGDVADFGAALTEIQRINGEWFAAAQGGVYAAGESARLVQQLREGGAAGVGQSSWGPTVYGLTADAVTARQLAAGARALIGGGGGGGGGGAVYEGRFSPYGARVGWEKPPTTVEQSSFRAS